MRPSRSSLSRYLIALCLGVLLWALAGCRSVSRDELLSRGEEIFFNETFEGNGRTCGTCHRAEDNFTITPELISTLPADDPLFVAEFNPELREGFEKPALMREFGLILENLDGFDDLENEFVLRGVPHTLALRSSVASPEGPRTGWSGDGSPGDGSLRSFATGAVIQHFPKTLDRIAGVDFRLPADDELAALEAFMLSLGRQEDLRLPLPLLDVRARRGQEIFLDDSLGKCNICHVNAGANANLGGRDAGNANFDTGVERLLDQPPDLTGARIPPDDGFGSPGDGTFNTPPLVESADTPPFFHNNAIQTLEGAVDFYSSDAFQSSPAGRILAGLDPNGVAIRLETAQVESVAAFLRALNALENIREASELLRRGSKERGDRARALLLRAAAETGDADRVLSEARLHPQAVTRLAAARALARQAAKSFFKRRKIEAALKELARARKQLVEEEQPARASLRVEED